MARDEAFLAELEAAPEVLADGTLLLPTDAFSANGDLPSAGDMVVVSWPHGLARGTCREFRFVVAPEIST